MLRNLHQHRIDDAEIALAQTLDQRAAQEKAGEKKVTADEEQRRRDQGVVLRRAYRPDFPGR